MPVSPSDLDSPCRSLGGRILRIVLVYAAFASLWIFVSDQVVGWLYQEPVTITLASTLKGSVFVLATSLLLYSLLRQLARSTPIAPVPATTPPPTKMALPFLLLAAALFALTVAAISHTYGYQRDKSVARLQAIADLKGRQIADWLKERQQDAEFVRSSRYLAENYLRWQISKAQPDGDDLKDRLEQLRQNRGYAAVTVLDAQGRRLWSSARGPHDIAPALRGAISSQRATRQVQRVGPYRGMRGNPHLDFVAPLARVEANMPWVVLHSEPGDWLYSTLQTWPVPNLSGETVLIRRDGDDVLYLNELRHRQGAAISLRMPLARKRLLAAQVLNGEVRSGSLVVGEDYRGVPVLGVVQAVAGTDWFLIAKQDRVELYEEATQDAIWMGMVGLLGIFMAGAAFYVMRQRQQLALSDGIREAQAERLRALGLLAAIAEGSDAAIFAKDLDGRYILFNRAAGEFVGQSPESVLGQDDRSLFPPAQAEQVIAYDQAVLAADQVITREEVLTAAAGERVFLGTKGPLRDEAGQVTGVFGIARDITERKRVENALREGEARFRSLFEYAPVGIGMLARDGVLLRANHALLRLFDCGEAELVGQHFIQWTHPADLEASVLRLHRLEAGEADHLEMEKRYLRRDGSLLWSDTSLSVVRDEDGGVAYFIVMVQDISARKAAEEALRDSEAMFRAMTASAQDAILMMDSRGRITFWNAAAERMFGYAEAEALGQHLHHLIAPERYRAQSDRGLFQFAGGGGGALVGKTMEMVGRRRDGGEIPVELSLSTFRMHGEFAASGILRDISERKRSEADMLSRNQELERFNRATIGRELDMVALKHQINALSRELGREPPYALSFLEGQGA